MLRSDGSCQYRFCKEQPAALSKGAAGCSFSLYRMCFCFAPHSTATEITRTVPSASANGSAKPYPPSFCR